jgi:universal stress protein A
MSRADFTGAVCNLRAASVNISVVAKMEPREDIAMKAGVPSVKIGTILAPVDFSDASKEALADAVAFARVFKARIVLLHAIQPLPYPADMTYVPLGQGFPVEPVSRELEELARVAVPKAMLAGAVVRLGVPHEVITDYAKEAGVDLIIIGTHGRSDLAHVFMGSTAERVVRHATCPVLVVRKT